MQVSNGTGNTAILGIIGLIGAAVFSITVWGALSWIDQSRAYRQEREAAHSEQLQASDQQAQAECSGVPRSRNFRCSLSSSSPPSDAQRSTADLHAQQNMAAWSFAMFIAATVSALITLAGVIFVAWTLHETRKMTGQAAKSTAAAEKAAEAATAANAGFAQASERELRAYVGIQDIWFDTKTEEANYRPVEQKPGVIRQDFLRIRAKNFGETPARNVTVRMWMPHFDAFMLPQKGTFDFEEGLNRAGEGELVVRALLQRGQDYVFVFPLKAMEQIYAARKKQITALVVGRIFYEDVFDRPWSTKFCFIWEPWEPRGDDLSYYEEFNDEDQARAAL